MTGTFKKTSLWRGAFKLCADMLTIPLLYPTACMGIGLIGGAMPGIAFLDSARTAKGEIACFGGAMAGMLVGGAVGLTAGTVLAGAVMVDNLVENIYRMAKGEAVGRGWIENKLLDKEEPSRFDAIMGEVYIPSARYG